MRRITLVAALLAALAAADGCGGNGTSSSAPRTVNGHRCTPANTALQCQIPPAPRTAAPPGAVVVAHGVDFAWGAPRASSLRAQGYRFGASYLSRDPSKGWLQRPGLVAEYHRAGLGTVAVWETTAARAGEGCRAGAEDARAARSQAAAVGNTDRPIDFAIDFDASGPQVSGYFRCAHALLGDRVNAYGGFVPLGWLCAHRLVGHTNWQTYAWSGGRWLSSSCAPLEQYQNGSSVDYDRALRTDYGQWPGPATPDGTKAALLRERARIRSRIHAHRCDVQRRHRKHLGPICRGLFRRGDVNRAALIQRYHYDPAAHGR